MKARLILKSIGLPLNDSSINTISRVIFTPDNLGGLDIPCPRRALLHRQATRILDGTHPSVRAATYLGFVPPDPNINPTPPASCRIQHLASAGITFRLT